MTLNQVIQQLKQLAESHKQVNHFDNCLVTDLIARSDFNYPAICIETMTPKVSESAGMTIYRFGVWFLDLLALADHSRANETEVLSDLTSIAQDFISMINSPNIEWQPVSNEYDIDFAVQKLTDYVCAASIEIQIGIPFDFDRCQVPTTNEDYNE